MTRPNRKSLLSATLVGAALAKVWGEPVESVAALTKATAERVFGE